MLKELFKEQRNNLDFFFDHIDVEKTQDIYQLFLQCQGTLVFTGVGKSGIIAEKLAMTMLSTGTKALYLPPMNALHGDIGIVTSDDVLICISKSGKSEELLSLVPFARKKGAKTVAWVSDEGSSLSKVCDSTIVLPLSKELCPFDLAPTTSTAIQLIFGDVLAVALMKAKQFSLDEYALNHPAGNIGKKITLKVEDLMVTGERLPICSPNDRLRDTLVTLTNKQCGCLLIVGADNRLQGIFTDGDLRRTLQTHSEEMLDTPMQDLMTTSFIRTHKEERAWDALRLMQADSKRRIMMMPVLDSDILTGLIRMHDIVESGIS